MPRATAPAECRDNLLDADETMHFHRQSRTPPVWATDMIPLDLTLVISAAFFRGIISSKCGFVSGQAVVYKNYGDFLYMESDKVLRMESVIGISPPMI